MRLGKLAKISFLKNISKKDLTAKTMSGKETKGRASSGQMNSKPAPDISPLKKMKDSELKEQKDFLEKIESSRLSFDEESALLQYKFEMSRVRTISEVTELDENKEGVVYWMSRDQRVQDNWALIFAQRLAIGAKVPLYVCFCLVPEFASATLRQYFFMLKGLEEVRNELAALGINFHLLLGAAPEVIPNFVSNHEVGAVVSDFSPLRVAKSWTNHLKNSLDKTVVFFQVDAHNIVPVWEASSKQEYGARTIRPKIHSQMAIYLKEFPTVVRHNYRTEMSTRKVENPFENWTKLDSFLNVDRSVKPVDWAKPGTTNGIETLRYFIKNRLRLFSTKRNDPNVEALSNLSPWFHFGQISVARAIMMVKKTGTNDSVHSFVEEAVVRRELADNFCFYNEDYDKLSGAAEWAQQTLNQHRYDARPVLYTKDELENAKTGDDLWNAAQLQMTIEGKMHGYLRMYWAKKILEWSKTPEIALDVAIYLNDKYSLDGRDPNGYVGCMWSICGVHDQGFAERNIFGKIRFMNYQGCKRKFSIQQFVTKYNKLAKDHGLQ